MRVMKRQGSGNNHGPEARDAPLRERILDAAFAAFVERGYADASTLEIATRARVSKREVYACFATKEAMLAACIKARAARMRRPLELPRIESRQGLVETLRTLGETLLREATHPTVVGVYRLAVAESQRSPEVARILNDAGREANHAALAGLLAQAQHSGLIADGDTRAMAAQFLALLWGDLLLRLILGVAKRPSAAQAKLRAQEATRDFLALHDAGLAEQRR